MIKRTERNKQLYKEIDKKIADIAKKHSNKAFDDTNNTLKSINPNLFGEQDSSNVVKQKKNNSQYKKVIITAIIFAFLFVLIIN